MGILSHAASGPQVQLCLTVQQPWAVMIVRGFKTVHFRDWLPSRHVLKQLPVTLLIHASKTPPNGQVLQASWDLAGGKRGKICRHSQAWQNWAWELPSGVTGGSADLTAYHEMPRSAQRYGRYAWHLEGAQEWDRPEPA